MRTEDVQAHRIPPNALTLFDGLFAALAAAGQQHAPSALLLARVLHRRLGARHAAAAKRYYEAAARGWSFDACVALLRMGDVRARSLIRTFAIGAEEEEEARRVLGGGTSSEEERLRTGEWLVRLPPNADAVAEAVLGVRSPRRASRRSPRPPLARPALRRLCPVGRRAHRHVAQ